MISVDEVINIHDILIDKYGGSHGIRDINALESAITRPFMTFDQKDLYPSLTAKASALIESLISNHPFIDGNGRTARLATKVLMANMGLNTFNLFSFENYYNQNVAKYYDESLLGNYNVRYNLFIMVVVFTGIIAIIVPFILR